MNRHETRKGLNMRGNKSTPKPPQRARVSTGSLVLHAQAWARMNDALADILAAGSDSFRLKIARRKFAEAYQDARVTVATIESAPKRR